MALIAYFVEPNTGNNANSGLSGLPVQNLLQILTNDPVSAVDDIRIFCGPGTDIAAVARDLSTLSANSVEIVTDPDYVADQTNASRPSMAVDRANVTINGSGSFLNTAAGGSNALVINDGASNVLISGIKARSVNGDGINVNAPNATALDTIAIEDCELNDSGGHGLYCGTNSNIDLVVRKNRCLNNGLFGIRAWNTNMLFNDNYAGGNGSGAYEFLDDFGAPGSSNNASDDTTGNTGFESIPVNTTTFVDPVNDDYSLPLGSLLRGTASDGGNIGGFEDEATGGITVSVPAATAAFSASAPTVQAGNSITISIPVASVSSNASVPTVSVSENLFIQVPEPTADFTAIAPTVIVTDGVNISVPVATAGFTANAPTVEVGNNQSISIPVAAFSVTAGAVQAGVSNNIELSVTAAVASFAANEPAVLAGDNQAIPIPAAVFGVSASAPTANVSQNLFIDVPVAASSFVAGSVLIGGDISISVPSVSLSVSGGVISVLSAIPETPASRTFVIPARDNTFYIG